MRQQHDSTYFDDLPEALRALVKTALLDTIDSVSGWRGPDELFEDIECHSRDGFIASLHNRGGLLARQFTDLAHFYGSGERVSHKAADKEIQRQIDYSLELAREGFYDANKDALEALGIKSAAEISYHGLYELGASGLAEEFSQFETENLCDDSSSIMFEVRFMYHGIDDDGMHSASVSCAVNTEGPYHRSSISWAPGVFCEGAKEVEITWKTTAGLQQKLERALQKTSGEVF